MRRKIYWNICLAALFSMFLATILTSVFLWRSATRQMESEIRAEVQYLKAAAELSGQAYFDSLGSHGDGGRSNRITWVDADGSVRYDSYTDSTGLENHAERPEIVQAFQEGKGQSIRRSDTLAKQTYYYAMRLTDGSVIRVASTMDSQFAALLGTLPWMAAMAVLIFVLTMFLAHVQTAKIVEPINQLDPEHPEEGIVYDELAPLVRRLMKQNDTIRRQMETLREKQEEFTAITENMKEGFIIVDSKADVISYNNSAVQILGADMAPGRENGQVNVLSMNRSSGFRRVVDAALNGERGEETLSMNGRYYQIIANPVIEEADGRKGAVVVILDVTEQQNREELRREFTANVSHELKTPLTSISGYAEIMKNGLVQPADMGRFSEKIYSEAQRLITLIGDIIKLSQLDEEKVPIQKTSVDLYQIASNVVGRLRDLAKANQVSVTLTGTPAVVQGAEQILDEMIFNVCENAVKYNRKYGDVSVTVGVENGHPTVAVKDTGIGIPEQDQERIFERFYRVDKSHSRQIGGTGLGLSIVKHGAIYHKAKVEMQSTLGVGTEIRIIF
ncbi:MAG: ATP-binding protein [Clostridiales bacterium]|nr:ATP-binding protein [Clostridiales bacterium]